MYVHVSCQVPPAARSVRPRFIRRHRRRPTVRLEYFTIERTGWSLGLSRRKRPPEEPSQERRRETYGRPFGGVRDPRRRAVWD